jgi:hypothetical protein
MSHVTEQSAQVPAVHMFPSPPKFLCAWQIRASMLSLRRSDVVERTKCKCMSFFSMALPAHSGPRPLIPFRDHFFTDGRTPRTSDQPVARPLPKHRTTQTQNKRIHTPNIHALSGIRTHDPRVHASKDSSCLRPRGCCDRNA